jgi:predicted RNase H-like nuclease (RuvC/YqgF family)
MTGDELERAIQFLLEGQAKNDALIGQLGVRVDQLTAGVARLTGDFADLKALVKEFAESTRLFAQRADERLDRLERNAEQGDRHRQRLETALAEGAERMNALTESMDTLTHVVERHITDETRHRMPPG